MRPALPPIFILVAVFAHCQPGTDFGSTILNTGARDTAVQIRLDPKRESGSWLLLMMSAEGIKLEIEFPDGRRMNQANAREFGGAWSPIKGEGFESMTIAPGKYARVNLRVFIPPESVAGQYRVHADAGTLREDAVLAVERLPSSGVEVEAAPRSRDTHYSGEKFEVIVSVKDNQRLIPDPEIVAQVAHAGPDQRTPVEPWTPVRLRPLGDGTFLTELPWTEAGAYRYAFVARGTRLNGENFTTGVSMSVYITQRLVRLVGIEDQGIDDEGHGKIDRINVAVRASVVIPNHYSAEVKVTTRSGKSIAAYPEGDLSAGEGTLTASFDRNALLRLEEDGPYTLSAGIAAKPKGGFKSATLSQITALSRPYARSDFDFTPIYFTGSNHAYPVPHDGVGPPYRQLQVNFEVFSPGGNCEWESSLTGNGSTPVHRGRGPMVVGPTQFIVVFSSYEIAKLLGQPIETGPTRLKCGEREASLAKPFKLPDFPPETFLFPDADFDMSTSLPEIVLIPSGFYYGHLKIRVHGDYDGPIQLSLDLPAGVTIPNFPSSVEAKEQWDTTFRPAVAESVAPGRYPVTIRARHKDYEHMLTCTLVVSTPR